MTTLEDEALCRAYVSVTVDSVTGANQTTERLWSVIATKYHAEPGILILRSPNSLQSRYQTFSAAVQFFVAKLNHAINNQGSGTNENDWVREAHDAYQLEKKKQFQFERCYAILKDHPKYDLNATNSNTQRSRFCPGESGGSSVNIEDDSSPIDIEGPAFGRPLGRNEAKMQQKRKAKEKALTVENAALQRAEQFSQLYEQNLARQEARHQEVLQQMERLIKCKENDLQRNIREEERRNRQEEREIAAAESRLMTIDTSQMDQHQRLLYDEQIQDMVAKMMRNRQASQNLGSSNFSGGNFSF